MASHGAAPAAGSDATRVEGRGTGQTNQPAYPPLVSGDHSWSSTTGAAAAGSWNYPVANQSQDAVYYDPQRDVSVSGDNQNVASSAPPAVQSTMGLTNASHSHVPYSSSLQHGYNPAEYANYYYNYPQATNSCSVQQGGANQHSGAAYQPLTSFQNSGSYVDPTSNTYYNAGGHQTAPGYATTNYYYQTDTRNDGSSGNNYAQSYQNYPSSDTNAAQSSSTVPANSFSYQQQYNQWPYYYNHSVPTPAGNPVAGSSNIDNTVVNTTSGYSYPSTEPPPPGTTPWKSNSSASVAPPVQVFRAFGMLFLNPLKCELINNSSMACELQHVICIFSIMAPSVPEPQNQYVQQAQLTPGFQNQYAYQAPGVPMSQNYYANQAPAYPQNNMNVNQVPLNNHGDQQKSVGSKAKYAGFFDDSSANNSSSLPNSTPRRRLKSRWEPVPEEKVTEKVEPLAKPLMNGNTHNNLKAQNRMGDSWNLGKSLQSPHAPSNKITHRLSKKQKMGSYSSVVQNGDNSSDSDKEKDLTKYYANASALANSPEEKKRREHRSKRFEKSKDSSSKSRNSAVNKGAVAHIHTRRPISALVTGSYKDGSSLAVEDMDWDALTVKGTCQEIEKRYLRLTSAPDPSTVRPEHVLEKALSMVETSQKNYLYKCDQLKSIRQDLTVQRIQNELTVKVYETHARLALQAGDLAEFNQCQSQLKRLYREGNNGCYFEFSAYNLLCVMLHSNNKRDLLSSMASLSKEAKQDGAVKHALAVHAAVSSGNYVIFFKLYKQGPNLNSCLMDLYVERMRFEAIKCMSRSYRPTVPVGYVAQVLGFLPNGDDRSDEIWLKAHGAVLSVDNGGELQIDTKASSSTLFMPEPENAVAHGDASLAVNDFFARTS
uniref:Uncharacterized protein n=1 Tax=Aegilops tauschii TaxID=37682 RepID=R7W8F0_AEGTA